LQVQLQVVDDVRDPGSAVSTQARFTVQAERPGALPA
jgi:hypothetical protein